MRRIVILAFLLLGMQLVLPLGARGHGAETLLSFGFLIVAAYTIGELVSGIRLPRIVGYIAAGVLFGPAVFGTVSASSVKALAPVSSLAIGLIAFLAGAELRWGEVRTHGIAILKILGTEMTVTFVCIVAAMVALQRWVPFLAAAPSTAELVVLVIVFSAMTIVHSPAVTMALLNETGARGPVARTTLGVVLVSDVVVVLLFSATLAVARGIMPTAAGTAAVSTGGVAWEIFGALIVGAALGAAVATYLRMVTHELFLFAILVTIFGLEIAGILHVEVLLTLLVAGFVMENFSRPDDGAALRTAMERSAAPVFVVFFALAGAEISLRDVAAVWTLVLPIVVIRLLGIWVGTRLGARWARLTGPEAKYVWMGLVSQAGVAIGLATVAAATFPERGGEIRTMFLAVIAVNEAMGPILFRLALSRAGELTTESGTADAEVAPAA